MRDVCDMQIRAAMTENSIFRNIFASMHDNITRLVSGPIFSWSVVAIKAFPVCKSGAAITKKHVLVIFFASTQHNVIKMVSKPIFLWSMINIKAFTTLSNVHMYLIWYNCEYSDSQNILYFRYNFRGFITRCPMMRLDVLITHLPNVWATRGIQYTEFHTERGWVTFLGRSTSWLGLRDPRHDSAASHWQYREK